MPDIIQIKNHYEHARDRLPQQFYDGDNIDGMLSSIFDSVQSVEDHFWAINILTRYQKAEGVQLDVYGEKFNTPRASTDESDVIYRLRITGEILERASDGTPDRVRRILEALSGITNTDFFEHPNTLTLTGGVFLYGNRVQLAPTPLEPFEAVILKKACPATIGSAVYGVHEQEANVPTNLFIPSELSDGLQKMGVDLTGSGSSLDELVDLVQDNITVRTGDNQYYGVGWEAGILPEIGGAIIENLVVQPAYEELAIETETGVEVFQVELTGIDAIATDHGIMLDTVQTSPYSLNYSEVI